MKPTPLFDTYWKFAAERQRIFWAKQSGAQPPFTADPILAAYKFTNPYRVTDRISQFLLREVIYDGGQNQRDASSTFQRILLFKIFNTEAAWNLIAPHVSLGVPGYSVDYKAIDYELTMAIEAKVTFWSAAYMMHAPHGSHEPKHRPYLRLVQQMVADGLPNRFATDIDSIGVACGWLSEYKMVGDFIAYQWAQDLNYAPQFDFADDYVGIGPGTRRGIHKAFDDVVSEHEAIIWCQRTQAEHFKRLGLSFLTIGRPLALGDIANLFCEFDKYTRVSNPTGDGKRIKQKFKPRTDIHPLMLPGKWKCVLSEPNIGAIMKLPAPLTNQDAAAVAAFVLHAIERSDDPIAATPDWYESVACAESMTFLEERFSLKLPASSPEFDTYYKPLFAAVMDEVADGLVGQ